MAELDITHENFRKYGEALRNNLIEQYNVVIPLKELGKDSSLTVESLLAVDLADRVAKLLDIPVAERLRLLLDEHKTEQAALLMAGEVASGKYPLPEGQSKS